MDGDLWIAGGVVTAIPVSLAEAAAAAERETPVSSVLWTAGEAATAARLLSAKAPAKAVAVAECETPVSGVLWTAVGVVTVVRLPPAKAAAAAERETPASSVLWTAGEAAAAEAARLLSVEVPAKAVAVADRETPVSGVLWTAVVEEVVQLSLAAMTELAAVAQHEQPASGSL